jgi:hypothetical protein
MVAAFGVCTSCLAQQAGLVRGVIRELEPDATVRNIERRIGDLPTAAGPGPKEKWARARRSSSLCRRHERPAC